MNLDLKILKLILENLKEKEDLVQFIKQLKEIPMKFMRLKESQLKI